MSSGSTYFCLRRCHENPTICYREYGASALGFSSVCTLLKDVLVGRDSRLPLVGSQANRLPPTWAAMWIDFHVLLLLLPVSLAVQPEPQKASKEASAAEKHNFEKADAVISQTACLLNTGTTIFFLLTCSSRAFAPLLAVFAVPVVSITAHSLFMRLVEHSSTVVGSVNKQKRRVSVNEVAVNALLALCVFVAFTSVPPDCRQLHKKLTIGQASPA